jgi:hypothetical protein
MPRHRLPLGLTALLAAAAASGLEAPDLEEVVVRARRLEAVASVESASQGIVLAQQLENRPALRASASCWRSSRDSS